MLPQPPPTLLPCLIACLILVFVLSTMLEIFHSLSSCSISTTGNICFSDLQKGNENGKLERILSTFLKRMVASPIKWRNKSKFSFNFDRNSNLVYRYRLRSFVFRQYPFTLPIYLLVMEEHEKYPLKTQLMFPIRIDCRPISFINIEFLQESLWTSTRNLRDIRQKLVDIKYSPHADRSSLLFFLTFVSVCVSSSFLRMVNSLEFLFDINNFHFSFD